MPAALAERAGEYTLHITAEPACSSLYRPDLRLVARYPELGVMRPVAEQRVSATTLDDWSRADGAGRVDFIKLDTQGSELDILRGAERVLDSVWGLEIEVEFSPLYQGQPLFTDVDTFLRARGFVLWRLTNLAHYSPGRNDNFTRWDVQHFDSRPVGFPAEGGQLYWGHAHYVRAGAPLGEYPSEQDALRAWCVWTITGWRDLADQAARFQPAGSGKTGSGSPSPTRTAPRHRTPRHTAARRTPPPRLDGPP